MKLIYSETIVVGDVTYTKAGSLVKVGDVIPTFRGDLVEVTHFEEPHKPSSSGKVSVKTPGPDSTSREFFVSVIGAEWIDREGRL